MAVSKLPYYLQRPYYQPKELEPTQVATDPGAQPGESSESPAPNVEPPPKGAVEPTVPATPTAPPPGTTTAPATMTPTTTTTG